MELRIEPQDLRPGSGGHGGRYPELDPELRAAVFDVFAGVGDYFPGTLGLRLVEARRGFARLEGENTLRLCQPAGVMHGGASFGMADTAVAYALMSLYGFESVFLTIEMKINYLEPIGLGPVSAEAYVLRATRKSAYAEIDVFAGERLAARASTTYAIRPKPPAKG